MKIMNKYNNNKFANMNWTVVLRTKRGLADMGRYQYNILYYLYFLYGNIGIFNEFFRRIIVILYGLLVC